MPRTADLSEQQKKCLRLVHLGLTSKEIAPLLATTPGVVDNYISAALARMALTSRREAARLLAQEEEAEASGDPMVQRLHLQPEAVAPLGGPSDLETRSIGSRTVRVFGLPPIGGRENDLTASQRLLALTRIAFFAALLLIATVVVVQGIITLIA
jgi:DNA-binding CsgD family transcriptional regulator